MKKGLQKLRAHESAVIQQTLVCAALRQLLLVCLLHLGRLGPHLLAPSRTHGTTQPALPCCSNLPFHPPQHSRFQLKQSAPSQLAPATRAPYPYPRSALRSPARRKCLPREFPSGRQSASQGLLEHYLCNNSDTCECVALLCTHHAGALLRTTPACKGASGLATQSRLMIWKFKNLPSNLRSEAGSHT